MNVAIFALTKQAIKKALEIKEHFENSKIYVLKKFTQENCISMERGFLETVKKSFNEDKLLVFIMASGIVVRTISKFLKAKDKDPAVLLCDERGKFVISLLSGHLGGANDFAKNLSEKISAVPIITTASDVSGTIALDTLASYLKAELESLETAKNLTSLIVNGNKISINLPKNIGINQKNSEGIVLISNKKKIEFSQIIPQNIIIGVGCRRGISRERVINAVYSLVNEYNLHIKSIKCFATVDIKKDELGILECANYFNRKLKIISREDIKEVENQFSASDFVKKTIGVSSVAEPCAYLGSNKRGLLLSNKRTFNGITLAIWEEGENNV